MSRPDLSWPTNPRPAEHIAAEHVLWVLDAVVNRAGIITGRWAGWATRRRVGKP